MDASKRNAAALHDRVERLCNAIIQDHLLNILRNTEDDEAADYSTAAHKELSIKEQAASLIRCTQDLSTLIRELQELWLFGSLDTLADRADQAANRAKALAVAEVIGKIAGQGPVVVNEGEENGIGVKVGSEREGV